MSLQQDSQRRERSRSSVLEELIWMLSWTCLPMSLSSSFLRVLAGGEREGNLTFVFFSCPNDLFFLIVILLVWCQVSEGVEEEANGTYQETAQGCTFLQSLQSAVWFNLISVLKSAVRFKFVFIYFWNCSRWFFLIKLVFLHHHRVL